MEKLIKFIKENNLTFNEGERNTNITILVGFSLAIEAEMGEILQAIKKSDTEYQNIFFIEEEIKRVYDYAEDNNYDDFWLTEEAHDQYTFEKID